MQKADNCTKAMIKLWSGKFMDKSQTLYLQQMVQLASANRKFANVLGTILLFVSGTSSHINCKKGFQISFRCIVKQIASGQDLCFPTYFTMLPPSRKRHLSSSFHTIFSLFTAIIRQKVQKPDVQHYQVQEQLFSPGLPWKITQQ